MKYLLMPIAVLGLLAACTSDPKTSESTPQAEDPAGRSSVGAETPAATPVHHEDARTRATLFRFNGPEEERPTNRR